jgi:hypothetical protein
MFHGAVFKTCGAEDNKVGSNTEFRLLPFIRDRLMYIAPLIHNVIDHAVYFGLPILGFGLWTKIEILHYSGVQSVDENRDPKATKNVICDGQESRQQRLLTM